MTAPSRPNAAASTPPVAAKKPVTTTHHGVSITDDYAWLRADNWQEVMRRPDALAADIRAYLEAENAHTAAALSDTAKLQATLFDEMKARMKQDDSSVPTPDGPYAYFSRFVPGKQYIEMCRQARDGGRAKVILDGNTEAKDQTYWSLGGAAHSPNHALLAYAVDVKGSEFYEIRFRNIATGRDLDERIEQASSSFVWANDSKSLVYVALDDNHRPLYVRAHTLGQKDDAEIYTEADQGFYVGVSKTQSDRFITIDIHDHQTSEIHLLDADDLSQPRKLVSPRREGHQYDVEHHDKRLIITTNSGNAEDQRIVEAPVTAPSEENWREVIPHEPGRLIINTIVLARHLIRLEREDGLPRIVIRRFADNQEHAIAFDEDAYSLGVASGYEFDTHTIRFTYSSMTTPSEVYDYDIETRTRLLRKRQEVPSGHKVSDYVTKRLKAPTNDGETVPISILYRRGTPLNGSAPLLLYGYGAYGIAIPASFSTTRLSLVDRGFVYAIAHIRGGKDKGYRWYKSGKRDAKPNTFKDFIAAGDHLVRKGYTSRGKIVAHGGSAGGMLMGAVANMAPELFLGLIANVPFVDVLNTMLDKDLPLTPPEWPEWGNPIANGRDFATIRAYSPYENVDAKAYPHIFALAGLTDPRVTYWEPAKWVARLRELKTDDNMLLLKTNMDAGHGGASGRFEHLKEVAQEYAFALKVSGKV